MWYYYQQSLHFWQRTASLLPRKELVLCFQAVASQFGYTVLQLLNHLGVQCPTTEQHSPKWVWRLYFNLFLDSDCSREKNLESYSYAWIETCSTIVGNKYLWLTWKGYTCCSLSCLNQEMWVSQDICLWRICGPVNWIINELKHLECTL